VEQPQASAQVPEPAFSEASGDQQQQQHHNQQQQQRRHRHEKKKDHFVVLPVGHSRPFKVLELLQLT
jgi:hypothetical protein